MAMPRNRSILFITQLIALCVLAYGLVIIAGTLLRQAHLHPGHDIDAIVVSLPLLIGISYVYLGTLLLRRKYNAWITATALSAFTLILNGLQLVHILRLDQDTHATRSWVRVLLPLFILGLLLVSRSAFRVKSDIRSFRQAIQVSAILLLAASLYGIGGFTLLDT